MPKLTPPVVAPFKGVFDEFDAGNDIVQDVAPQASLSLLREVGDLVHWACTAPYPIPAVWASFAAQTYFPIRFNVGAQAMRAYITRAVTSGSSGTPANTQITSTSSGLSIEVASGQDGTDVYPPQGDIVIIATSDGSAPSALGGTDRRLELGVNDYQPAALASVTPYNEGISVRYGAGFGGSWFGVETLTTTDPGLLLLETGRAILAEAGETLSQET